MGCFNLSCFASRQTIAPTDRCTVVPILLQTTQPVSVRAYGETSEQYGVASTPCYPGDVWRPFSGPIKAIYDDYGRVKLLNTPINRHFLRGFFCSIAERAAIVEQGENPYHEKAFDFNAFIRDQKISIVTETPEELEDPNHFMGQATLCWDVIWEQAREGRLFVCELGTRHPVSLQFAILHEKAASALVALASKGRNYAKQSLAPRAYFDRCFDEAEASEKLTSIEIKPDFKAYHFAYLLESTVGRMSGESLRLPGLTQLLSKAIGKQGKGKRDRAAIYQVLRPYIEFSYLVRGLAMLNLYWSPLVTSGQDYSNELGVLYAKFVLKSSKAVSALVKARNND